MLGEVNIKCCLSDGAVSWGYKVNAIYVFFFVFLFFTASQSFKRLFRCHRPPRNQVR